MPRSELDRSTLREKSLPSARAISLCSKQFERPIDRLYLARRTLRRATPPSQPRVDALLAALTAAARKRRASSSAATCVADASDDEREEVLDVSTATAASAASGGTDVEVVGQP